MTTPPPSLKPEALASLVERKFLLIKRGLYYRPDSMGYTGIKEYAGRYLESDASPESGVKAVHEDDAADYSPACFEDLKIDHLKGKIAEAATALEALAAERDALMEAVIQYRDDLRHPPAPDSKERRLEMIAKLIGKD